MCRPQFRLYEPAEVRNRATAAGSAPAPSRRLRIQNGVDALRSRRAGSVMPGIVIKGNSMPVTRIGLDLAKNVFQAHGADEPIGPARGAERLRLAVALPNGHRSLIGLASLGARRLRPSKGYKFGWRLRWPLVRRLRIGRSRAVRQ